MGFVWSVVGVPATLMMLVAFALAALVYAVRPDRVQNRALALVLVVEGIGEGLINGLSEFTNDPTLEAALVRAGYPMLWAMPAVYLTFYSTLETRLARPLRSRLLLSAVWLATALLIATWFLRRDAISGWFLPWTTAISLLLVGGLVLALGVYAEAPSEVARRRGRMLVAAFAFRDVLFLVYILLRNGGILVNGDVRTFIVGCIFLGYTLLLAYGILKAQLFDIDLRIRAGIKRGAVAFVFVAVFFVVDQVAGALLERQFGPIVGLGALALLTFALAPLQRFGERVASAAMPSVEPTQDYVALRKLDVYRAALESAKETGGEVTARETAVLGALRAKLGLSAEEARAVERETEIRVG